MSLIVCEHPLSPYAQEVKIALDEKAVAYKREYRDHRLEWMIRSGGLDVVLEGIRDSNIRFSNVLS